MLKLLLFSTIVALTYAQVGLIVETKQGPIQGTVASDGNYNAFYGIPYAGTTAGENRFKAPTPPPTRQDLFYATNDTILCVQPSEDGSVGVEDCLRLNIFTKNITAAQHVIVWLAGEEYTTSKPLEHSFRKLVEGDVVVVALNYRVSVFGFLCLGIEKAPGNAGLKDVIQGLKWVHDNIAAFGGDPSNVTLFGHGSTAAMADLVTMSPLARNLMHKVIAHSGSALAPWAVSYDPIGSAYALGKKLGFNGDSVEELAEFLKSADAESMISAIEDFELLDNTVLFAPCIENGRLGDSFLVDTPIDLLRSGNYHHVPYITGYTDKEGTIRAKQAIINQWLEKMQSNFTYFLPLNLNIKTEVEESIRHRYFENNVINMTLIEDYLEYHGDTMITIPLIWGAIERSRLSREEVRLLEFRYIGTNTPEWNLTDVMLTGVPHGGILNYLLDFDLREQDQRVMTSLLERYEAFLQIGDPSPLGSIIWRPMTANTPNYMLYDGGDVFNRPPIIWKFIQAQRSHPSWHKYTFWRDIYQEHYVPPPNPNISAINASSLVIIMICYVMTLL